MNNPVMNICKPTFVFWWVFKRRSWLSIRNTRIPYDASKTVKFLVTMYIMVTISVYAVTSIAIFVVFSWGDLRTCDCNESWIMGKLFKEILWSIMSNVNCVKPFSHAVISHQNFKKKIVLKYIRYNFHIENYFEIQNLPNFKCLSFFNSENSILFSNMIHLAIILS